MFIKKAYFYNKKPFHSFSKQKGNNVKYFSIYTKEVKKNADWQETDRIYEEKLQTWHKY